MIAVVSMSGVSFLTTFAHVTEMRPTRGVSLTIEPQFEILPFLVATKVNRPAAYFLTRFLRGLVSLCLLSYQLCRTKRWKRDCSVSELVLVDLSLRSVFWRSSLNFKRYPLKCKKALCFALVARLTAVEISKN